MESNCHNFDFMHMKVTIQHWKLTRVKLGFPAWISKQPEASKLVLVEKESGRSAGRKRVGETAFADVVVVKGLSVWRSYPPGNRVLAFDRKKNL